MIIFPRDWQSIGQPIKLADIESAILDSISECQANSLAFSGGIDSSILLFYLSKLHSKVDAFTIGLSNYHPDVIYSIKIVKLFPNVEHHVYIPTKEEISKEELHKEEYKGDIAVRLLYKFIAKHTDNVITGDGIDEFMCGYYAHQSSPTERTYFEYLKRLQKEQLAPLDKNSGNIKVWLPYCSDKLISLMSQIPLGDKVDHASRKKILYKIAQTKFSSNLIDRRKIGLISALKE